MNMYELQKSRDGVNFSAIAIAFAKGNQRNNYDYTDAHPFDGTNFYRLKMIDIDGTYTYSKIVMVNFGDIKASYVTVAPNPVKTSINVQMTALPQGTYRVEVTNSIGQVQLAKKINVTQYNQKEIIPCPATMNTGIYHLSIYDGKNNRVKTIGVFISNN